MPQFPNRSNEAYRSPPFPHVPPRTWRHARLALLAAASGVLVGLAGFTFLEGLDWATRTRLAHDKLVWFLPLAGLAMGLAYHRFGGRAGGGNALLLKEIHEPSAWVPRRMAPMVAGATVVSHLFGASVGREGTALQMSGSLTDMLNRTFGVRREDRRVLLIAALGGGFGAVFGVPFAGLVFGIEVQWIRRLQLRGGIRWLIDRIRGGARTGIAPEDRDTDEARPVAGDDLADRSFSGESREVPNARLLAAIVPTAIASFVGNFVVRTLGHVEDSPARFVGAITAPLLLKATLIGLAAGVTAVVFVALTEGIRHRTNAIVTWPPLRPFVGGIVTLALAAIAGHDYLGLSLHLTDEAFAGELTSFAAPSWKLVLTAVCLGTGFIGGEVTPMFVMGATLGAAMGNVLGLDPALGAGLGFAAVFAGAANAPIACTVLAIEIFGIRFGLPAAAACAVSFVASGRWGIYHHPPAGTATITSQARRGYRRFRRVASSRDRPTPGTVPDGR
ncbi:MAG: chloride channel protein [Actinobacteria bacterium]|nr:chloride channel protein [Actinomycetota bacterium]